MVGPPCVHEDLGCTGTFLGCPGRPQHVDTVAFSLLQQIFNMSVPVAQCLQIQVTIPFKMDRS